VIVWDVELNRELFGFLKTAISGSCLLFSSKLSESKKLFKSATAAAWCFFLLIRSSSLSIATTISSRINDYR
jgi:hypothetical protein